MQKHNHLSLLFVVVSKCRLNVNSKLSINVTCNKARLKNLSSAFDDTNEHEIKRLYSVMLLVFYQTYIRAVSLMKKFCHKVDIPAFP